MRSRNKEADPKHSVGETITEAIAPEVSSGNIKVEPEIPTFYAQIQGTPNAWIVTIKSDDEKLNKIGSHSFKPIIGDYGEYKFSYDVEYYNEKDVVNKIPLLLKSYIASYNRCKVKYDVRLEDFE